MCGFMEKDFGTMNDVTERSVTIGDFFAAVKKNLVMVVVVAVVVAVIGFIYTFFVAKERGICYINKRKYLDWIS